MQLWPLDGKSDFVVSIVCYCARGNLSVAIFKTQVQVGQNTCSLEKHEEVKGRWTTEWLSTSVPMYLMWIVIFVPGSWTCSKN